MSKKKVSSKSLAENRKARYNYEIGETLECGVVLVGSEVKSLRDSGGLISESYNIGKLDIDSDNSYILNHNWKGNVRELRNLIERIAILQPNTKDKVSNIVKESLKNDSYIEKVNENTLYVTLKEAIEKFEKEYLTIQLKKFN